MLKYKIPQIVTLIPSTKGRYDGYQTLVHRIPSIGTTNTQRWYGAYQALVQHYQRVTE